MADSEGPTPKVLLSVPPGYWDLPEDLAAAEPLTGQLQEGLPPSS
jgi:hypothetical protein